MRKEKGFHPKWVIEEGGDILALLTDDVLLDYFQGRIRKNKFKQCFQVSGL